MRKETTTTTYTCDVCGAEHSPVINRVTFSMSNYSPWVCSPNGFGGDITNKYEDLCPSCNEAFSETLYGLIDKIKNKNSATPVMQFTSKGVVVGEINATGPVCILGPNKGANHG